MAFVSISAALLQVGKAIKAEWLNIWKINFDDLDSRQTALESVTQRVVIFDNLIIGLGQYPGASNLEQFASYRCPLDLNIISFEITQLEAGSAGTLEMDLKTGVSHASLSSIMTTKPSLSFSAGDNATSVNQVFAVTAVSEGDYITLDVTQIQTGMGRCQVTVLAEPA